MDVDYEQKIHSPYIRSFVQFHGLMGMQLSSIHWHDWCSLLRFLFNISLNGFVFYGTYVEAYDKPDEINKASYLYKHFLQACLGIFYPLVYGISIICLLVYGQQIIKHLDSSAFFIINRNCQSNHHHSKVFIFYIIIILIWDQHYLLHGLHELLKLDLPHLYVVMFSVHFKDISQLINWYILFYHQLIIFYSLQQIVRKFNSEPANKSMRKTENNFSIEKRLFNSIKNLSENNRRLQYYCSYLLFGILIQQTNYVIDFLTLQILRPSTLHIGLSNIIAHTLRLSLGFFLVLINHRNIRLFDQIDKYFRSKCIGKPHHHNRTLRYGKYIHLQIYRSFYKLSVFTWLDIDLSLIPHIRTFVQFHRLMGVQLSSIQWYDWRSLFTLLFNLLLNGFIIYGIYIESNEKHDNVNKSIYLYEHFLQASITHKIIFHYDKIYGQLSTTNKSSSIRKTGNNFSIEKRLFNSIKNLSVHNRHIQYYLSYLLFGILIEQTNSIIHFLTFFIVDPRRTSIGLSNIIAQTLRNCLCFFLVQLNQRNICLFDQIDRHFRSKCIANHHHHHHRDNSITTLRYSKYNQLQIYRQYHQLSVFQWLNIDSSVLVQLFFFSLSYVLIISQTTKLID
ncbi:hypothetical protein DERF_004134 [Dermatophagoides farinae]|uniref:Gustatory receptor n=1 Tax=Dermatophagoides farinae TaxID=6954 RepID=A0A922LB97_DERFA|nr:hypothetical protein DERF_004134 [Dermatophagoides farinae]